MLLQILRSSCGSTGILAGSTRNSLSPRVLVRTWSSSSSLLQQRMQRLVLGIETSCDETGAAVIDEDGKILGEGLYSQKRIHVKCVYEKCPFIYKQKITVTLSFE